MNATTLTPRAVADVAAPLRERSVELLGSLSDAQLEVEAVPTWSVADVFRHLAEADRTVVLLSHLVHFLPSRDLESANDRALARLRALPRERLQKELAAWGRRLRAIMRVSPAPLGRARIATMFGRVSLAWFASMRVYDEWVHQHDVTSALGMAPPELWPELRDILAEMQLRGLAAKPVTELDGWDGVVEVQLTDSSLPPWRFDLDQREFGVGVTREPSAQITTDVATWTLLAADRVKWRDEVAAGRITIDGDQPVAEAVLAVVRIV